MLALLVVPILRPWFTQRSDLASERAQVAALEQQVAQLQAQKNRWSDPTYVEAQARQRLRYVMPGEVGYVMVPTTKSPAASSDPASRAAAAAASVSSASVPWYTTVWRSVLDAGDPSVSGTGTVPR